MITLGVNIVKYTYRKVHKPQMYSSVNFHKVNTPCVTSIQIRNRVLSKPSKPPGAPCSYSSCSAPPRITVILLIL